MVHYVWGVVSAMSKDRTHPESIWQTVLGRLQLQVTKPNFDAWLRATRGLELAGGTFVVSAPNALVAEVLQERLYSIVAKELETSLEREVEVEFRAGTLPEYSPPPEAGDVEVATVDPQQAREISRPALVRAKADANLQADTTFDTMVVGACNEYAYALATAVSDEPATYENPLVVYGAVGMGKTHLMQAIGHRYVEGRLRVLYQSTTGFTADFTRAIRERETDAWRDRYREYNAVLIDDVQDLVGKEQTQVAFFEVYTQSLNSGIQLILALDRSPTSISPGSMDDRVRSRLNSGAVVGLDPPDRETRLAYIQRILDEHSIEMPDESVQYIARNVITNFRDLRQACLRVLRRHILSGRPDVYENYFTIDQIKTVVPALESSQQSIRNPQDVLKTVADHYGMSVRDIRQPGRRRMVSEARQVAMFILHEDMSMTYRHIADMLSLKSHATVIRQCRAIGSAPEDEAIARAVSSIRDQLLTH